MLHLSLPAGRRANEAEHGYRIQCGQHDRRGGRVEREHLGSFTGSSHERAAGSRWDLGRKIIACRYAFAPLPFRPDQDVRLGKGGRMRHDDLRGGSRLLGVGEHPQGKLETSRRNPRTRSSRTGARHGPCDGPRDLRDLACRILRRGCFRIFEGESSDARHDDAPVRPSRFLLQQEEAHASASGGPSQRSFSGPAARRHDATFRLGAHDRRVAEGALRGHDVDASRGGDHGPVYPEGLLMAVVVGSRREKTAYQSLFAVAPSLPWMRMHAMSVGGCGSETFR